MPRCLRRNVLFALALVAATGTSACMDSPTEPRPLVVAPALSDDPVANYTADATVTAGGLGEQCGSATAVGQRWAGVLWRVDIEGESISVDVDLRNWPDSTFFTGTLRGRSFEAHHQSIPDYLNYGCQFREASLTGTFAADFDTFEVHEVLFFGPPDNEGRVERVWRGRRM
jgi:hypothetical protein